MTTTHPRPDTAHQTTDTVLLVRPAAFAVNAETAGSNEYQQKPARDASGVPARAAAEFDTLVAQLEASGVRVLVMADTPDPPKPDAVFPNNWFSTHADGTVVLYPLEAPNRRAERRREVVDFLGDHGFEVARVVDYAMAERRKRFLEGTGSMVLDHVHRLCYAALSSRTDVDLLHRFCRDMGYEPVTFTAMGNRHPIYHTNVMLAVGSRIAVVGLQTLPDPRERTRLRDRLVSSGRELIEVTPGQVSEFAGNVLELRGREGPVLVLSRRALDVLDENQVGRLSAAASLLPASIPTIECGGGSARCMLAEVFLPASDTIGP